MRPLAAAVIVLVQVAAFGAVAQEPPLPDRDAFFADTKANLLKSQREQVHYAYRERRTDLHTNPFGKLGTDGSRVFDVTPGSTPGVFYRTLIERNGHPVTGGTPERVEGRRRDRPASRTGRSPIDDALETLEFRIERREQVDGRSAIVVAFAPKPDADPDTREGKLAREFKGEVRVDEAAREVMRVDAVAVDDLTFGFGLVARMNEGTRVTMTRQKVDAIAWLPTLVRFMGEGRAMLFRKLVLDYRVEWSDYRRVE